MTNKISARTGYTIISFTAQLHRKIALAAVIILIGACQAPAFVDWAGSSNVTFWSKATKYDFDGDQKANISVFRPSTAEWFYLDARGSSHRAQFGSPGDIPVPADYDGDGKADLAVFRDGTWYRSESSAGLVDPVVFGLRTDVPVPADFDGDGKADIALFRPEDGTWSIAYSDSGLYDSIAFGQNGDIPLVGDYDGDKKADISIYRPSEGTWYLRGDRGEMFTIPFFGKNGDVPLSDDFDGDGRSDMTLWHPSDGTWSILRSSDSVFATYSWGTTNDIPVPADYDGDGVAEPAVYRPSDGTWYRFTDRYKKSGYSKLGETLDLPIPSPIVASKARTKSRGNEITVDPAADLVAGSMTANAGSTPQSTVANTVFPVPLAVTIRDASNNPVPNISVTFTASENRASGTFSNGSRTISSFTNASGVASQTFTANRVVGRRYSVTADSPGLSTVNFYLTNTTGPVAVANAVYVAPSGSPSGTGSITSPYDLQTALNGPSTVQPGTTIYLRGGTYYGRFLSSLTGTSSNPITVRSYPGEWARIDGYLVTNLPASIGSSGTTVSLNLPPYSNVSDGTVIQVDNEDMYVTSRTGSQITAARPWNGTQAAVHSSGAPIWLKGHTLTVNGADTIYRDFEVLDSNPNRSFSTNGDPSGRKGGEGIYVFGPRTKYINLVIHDAQDGMFLAEGASDVEVYGVITYNNGHSDPNRGNGHGLYIQNRTGTKQIRNVTSFNNYATGMKGYGEGGYANNLVFDQVVSFNNSSPAAFPGNPSGYSSNHRFVNLHVGTAVNPPQNITITSNYLYQPPSANTEEGNIKLGYISSGGQNLTIANNYIMGGDGGLSIIGFNNASVTGNYVYAKSYLALVGNSDLSGSTWNNNHYFDLGPLNSGNVPYSFNYNSQPNRFGGGNITYDDPGTAMGKGWKQWTGFDSSSTYVKVRPTGLNTIIRRNQYQSGRATVIVYNWDLAANLAVNLSTTGLAAGQRFEIRNVQNYFSAPLLSNQTYSSGMTVNLPLTGLSVATPIGSTFTPASTCPEFCVFEIVPLS